MSVTNSLKPWAFKYNMLLITRCSPHTKCIPYAALHLRAVNPLSKKYAYPCFTLSWKGVVRYNASHGTGMSTVRYTHLDEYCLPLVMP